LAPYLTPENAADLLGASSHRTVMEIRVLLAERFPRLDVAARVEVIGSGAGPSQLPTSAVAASANGHPEGGHGSQVPTSAVGSPAHRVTPLSAERCAFEFTGRRSAYDKLKYVQALLGHAVPSGDVGEIFERAMDALIEKQEKQKFAATSRPGPRRSSADPRHIPAHVKHTVWERDGAQCTFVGDTGNRCPARTRLEFDHVDPVARGGLATVEGIRLRCRAHNQYEAECTFGVGFMEAKREAARVAAAEARARAAIARAEAQEKRAAAAEQARAERARTNEARAQAAAERVAAKEARAVEAEQAQAERSAAKEVRVAEAKREKAERAAAREEKAKQEAAERDPDRSVVPWLRQLGFTIDEARRAAVYCESMPDVALEKRIREAIRYLSPQHRPVKPFATSAA
jgi:hypothetical protein